MGIIEDLRSDVGNILKTSWQMRKSSAVPEPEQVSLGNDAVTIEGAVLYADLADSTGLVSQPNSAFAAEVFKCFLHCAAKIIRAKGGVITAYDGDRVMAVFVGSGKEIAAARVALAITYVVNEIITPALAARYPGNTYRVRHATGVDAGRLFVAKTGIRGSNDLVWVGQPANYAAKLAAFRDGEYSSWITDRVFTALDQSHRRTPSGQDMWETRTWTKYSTTIHRSKFHWSI